MRSLELGDIWSQRKRGEVPGNLNSEDNLLVPTLILSLAVGAREDSGMGWGWGVRHPFWPLGEPASPSKSGPGMSGGVWGKGELQGLTHPPADQCVSKTDPAFPEPR